MPVIVGIINCGIGRQEMNRVSVEGFHQESELSEK